MKKPSLLQLIWLGLLVLWISSCGVPVALTPDVEPTSPTPTDAATQLPAVNSNPGVLLLRGNPQRTGIYDTPAIRHQPDIHWQSKIDYTLLTPPLVADGLLYTISMRGVMYALDVETGKEVWSVEGLGQHENTGAIAAEMIISAGIHKQVRARDRQNGNELWAFETDYPIQGAPLVVDDRVYIATDRQLYTLELETGELIWNTATGEEEAFMGAPAYEDGIIYTTGGKVLIALDSQTGEEIWRAEKEEHFLGLAVANNTVYVGNWDRTFYAFNRLTGEERWNFQADSEFWSAPAVTSETVYAGNHNELYVLDVQNGELLWTFEASMQPVSEPLVTDGVVYFSDSNHEVPRGPRSLYALDAITGQQLWVFEKESTYLPAPALGDSVIYITLTGEVIALK